jgi:hypothetical protein
MTTVHTPGPWKTMPEELHRPYIRIRGTRLGGRYKVANVHGPDYKDAHENEAEETRANAALIEAAPDMKELIESAPKTAHLPDYRGPCLCSSCAWSRDALAMLAKLEATQ